MGTLWGVDGWNFNVAGSYTFRERGLALVLCHETSDASNMVSINLLLSSSRWLVSG